MHCMRVNTLGPMRLSQILLGNLKRGRDKKALAIGS